MKDQNGEYEGMTRKLGSLSESLWIYSEFAGDLGILARDFENLRFARSSDGIHLKTGLFSNFFDLGGHCSEHL